MADDDMLPDFRIHPRSMGGLALSSDPDPTLLRPFPDRPAVEAWALPSSEAIGTPHLRLLGRQVRGLLLEAGEVGFARADCSFLSSSLGTEARVAALCFGTWGDSGIPANRYLLALRGLVDPGEPCVYEGDNYAAALRGRIIFRSPLRTTIGGRTFMGGHIALDARSLLPPFSPQGRDEDGLWGFCLGILHPRSAIAFPIQAILHEPPNVRLSSRDEALRWDLCLNETLRSVIGIMASRHEAGEAAYVSLGGRLASIAAGPRQEFRHALAEATARSMTARIGLLEQALDEYGGEPEAWAVDVKAAIAALSIRIGETGFWLPREYLHLGYDRAEDALVDHVLRFGELCRVWPALFKTATAQVPGLLDRSRLGKR